jgi:chromatin assembly factor 1 subunit B
MIQNSIQVKIWEIVWHNKSPILSIDFHPQQNKLATSGEDNSVKIWSYKDKEIKFLSTLIRHTKTVNTVRFSPCGKYLASGTKKLQKKTSKKN